VIFFSYGRPPRPVFWVLLAAAETCAGVIGLMDYIARYGSVNAWWPVPAFIAMLMALMTLGGLTAYWPLFAATPKAGTWQLSCMTDSCVCGDYPLTGHYRSLRRAARLHILEDPLCMVQLEQVRT
jgi:hypothetical protein